MKVKMKMGDLRSRASGREKPRKEETRSGVVVIYTYHT
jgi:hypothetical protein